MRFGPLYSCVLVLMFNYIPCHAIFLVVPEDVQTGLMGFYGFAPGLRTGTDNRLGFGFRLGNHADFQILYEFGPQQTSRPLRIRSAPYKQRVVRRRPFIQFLVNAGFLRISAPSVRFSDDEEAVDEPR